MFDFQVVRKLRREAGMTITEMAERSGVSSAAISRMERNQGSVDLSTLFRVARALGITATELMALTESRTAQRVSADTYHSGNIAFRKVSYGNLNCFHTRLKAGERISRREVHQDEYEVCWALSGRVQFMLPDETHTLETGDALQFDAVLPHTYEALEDAELVMVHLQKKRRF